MADPDYYTVRVILSGAHVTLTAPYHGDLPKRAREIGGTWDKGARAWTFPAEREEQARDLARLLFQTDDGPVPKDLDRRSTSERSGKKKGAKGKSGLAAYSTDDLLAELRRRGVVPAAPTAEPTEKPKAESGAERAARLNARRGAEHVTRNDAGDGNDPDLFSL